MWPHKNKIGLGVLIGTSVIWSIVCYYSLPTLTQTLIGYGVCIFLGGVSWCVAAFRLD